MVAFTANGKLEPESSVREEPFAPPIGAMKIYESELPMGVPVDQRRNKMRYEEDDFSDDSAYTLDEDRDYEMRYGEALESDRLINSCCGRGSYFFCAVSSRRYPAIPKGEFAGGLCAQLC